MTIPYPNIPPVIVSIGPLAIRWYGVMYAVGYVLGYRLVGTRTARAILPLSKADLDSWIGYLVIGMIVGARLVYAAVYDRPQFVRDPMELLRVWHGGLSFHGAVLGMTVACMLFARVHRVRFLAIADLLALGGTPGLFFGRLGNFINGELYGRPSNVPWAMVFPADPLRVPRHPSQLYEALAEGVLLGLIVWIIARWSIARGWYRSGLLAGAFLIGYGVFRFLIEFTRQPDAQLGLIVGPFSMGQLLSVGMPVLGVVLLTFVMRAQPAESTMRIEK
ncbi:MAG: prolipoprotein diacylglyceryl transferase [Gemmatimonadota bacterium]|nr:prolipoprotein diacylglyceryl transferase [Gemmatimonadota bacterium]